MAFQCGRFFAKATNIEKHVRCVTNLSVHRLSQTYYMLLAIFVYWEMRKALIGR